MESESSTNVEVAAVGEETETVLCPVCESEMVPSNGVKVVCVACGFEGARSG
ncbi:MAG: hypothetical protein V1696_00025 [Candidatus Jorgensenbacteria bacterium]